MSRGFGLRGVTATIVWHPGWRIVHKQVEEGRAVRLWPDPVDINLGRLPRVHPKELTFRDESRCEIPVSSSDLEPFERAPLCADVSASELVWERFDAAT